MPVSLNSLQERAFLPEKSQAVSMSVPTLCTYHHCQDPALSDVTQPSERILACIAPWMDPEDTAVIKNGGGGYGEFTGC